MVKRFLGLKKLNKFLAESVTSGDLRSHLAKYAKIRLKIYI
ncbi:hypothetical protein APA_2225 [Pseudanabaena sp. lw0831]|nr:hypothetical protein APA_2225 [Pseudanabaena sp. lw0831]